eukprot:TRINITY_DN5137_c0_g1_i1.p1 TRINITY_DN5137_c0_g1~~TRINITY_DN5137_c0_g1_i1.p1  ORF type:complete len:210 (-),score=29.19 TRINITY_DN5137_c0_g1_i1:36-665(-)
MSMTDDVVIGYLPNKSERMVPELTLGNSEDINLMGSIKSVVIVLGKRLQPDGSPLPMLTERVKKGVEKFNEVKSTEDVWILMSGGTVETGNQSMRGNMPSEAKVMGDIAIGLGIPVDRLILESQSRTTVENMIYTKKLIDGKFDKCYLVTSEFHIDRSMVCFKNICTDFAEKVEPVPHDSHLDKEAYDKEMKVEKMMLERYKVEYGWKY